MKADASRRMPYVPASKARSADAVLYLDLDGVVHHEAVVWHPGRGISMSESIAPGHILFEWIHHLEEALRSFPQVALVLSSTWCVRVGYMNTLKRLPETIRARFIGATYHSRVHGETPWTKEEFLGEPRGVQVCADAERRWPRQWAALDDDSEGWPEDALDRLILCDGRRGLSDAGVRLELHQWLSSVRFS